MKRFNHEQYFVNDNIYICILQIVLIVTIFNELEKLKTNLISDKCYIFHIRHIMYIKYKSVKYICVDIWFESCNFIKFFVANNNMYIFNKGAQLIFIFN